MVKGNRAARDRDRREHAVRFDGGDGDVGIVLCHGFTGSPFSLRPFADHLVDAGFRVSLPLLPGHGSTWQELGRTTWQQWYAEVDRALVELSGRCEQVFVVGLSMGGALALRLAQRHAGVRGIVLVNPSLTTLDKRFLILPLLSRLLSSVAGITDDIAKPDVTEYGYDRTPLQAVVQMTELWADVRANLPRVTQPILMFRSVTDHVVDASSSRLLLQRVGSSDVTERMLDRSFHVATLDYDAEDIFAESVDFIRRHAEGVAPAEGTRDG